MNPSALRMAAVVVCATFLINGCSTTRIHAPPGEQNPGTSFEAGDTVDVVLRTGETVTLTVAELQPGLLIGHDDRDALREIPWDDVAAVTTSEVDAGKTAAAIGGSLLFFYVIGAVATVSLLGAGF